MNGDIKIKNANIFSHSFKVLVRTYQREFRCNYDKGGKNVEYIDGEFVSEVFAINPENNTFLVYDPAYYGAGNGRFCWVDFERALNARGDPYDMPPHIPHVSLA